jgi:hypothetical protein
MPVTKTPKLPPLRKDIPQRKALSYAMMKGGKKK